MHDRATLKKIYILKKVNSDQSFILFSHQAMRITVRDRSYIWDRAHGEFVYDHNFFFLTITLMDIFSSRLFPCLIKFINYTTSIPLCAKHYRHKFHSNKVENQEFGLNLCFNQFSRFLRCQLLRLIDPFLSLILLIQQKKTGYKVPIKWACPLWVDT